MNNKTVKELAEESCNREGLSWENEYAIESFISGFFARKKVEQKIITDKLNKYKSWLSQETRVKLTKTINEDKIRELEIKIEVLNELMKAL